jgi:hypothetical protein
MAPAARHRSMAVLISIAACWLAALCAWPLIALPFSNPLGITGPLTAARFNPANNLVRYLVFVLAPSLGFVLAGGLRLDLALPRRSLETPLPRGFARAALAIAGTLVALRVLHFFQLSLAPNHLDFIHEGESLSAGYNFLATHKLWSGTFFVHGLFYDPLRAVLAWKLFGHQTIGAARLFGELLEHGIIVSLAIFLGALALAIRSEAGHWHALSSLLILGAVFTLTEGPLQQPDLRDCLALAIAAVFLGAIARPRLWLLVLAGLLAGLGLFNTIERGAYIAAASLAVLGVSLVLRRRRADALALLAYLLGFAFALALVRFAVGAEEWRSFLESFGYWSRYKDLMDGFVYPAPFQDDAPVFTTPLVMNGLSLLGWLAAVPAYARLGHWRRLGTHTFLVAAACLFYRSALGRADAQHASYVATLAYLAFAWTLANWLPEIALRRAGYFALLGLLLPTLTLAYFAVAQRERIFSFGARAAEFVSADDDAFLWPPQRAALAGLRERFASEPCSFVYGPWPAMHYLLKKPSCSQFYFTWFATAVPHQRKVIAALEEAKPRQILDWPIGRKGLDGIGAQDAYPELDAWLRSHYSQGPSLLPPVPDEIAMFFFAAGDWIVSTRNGP